jgi:hypothetical protein
VARDQRDQLDGRDFRLSFGESSLMTLAQGSGSFPNQSATPAFLHGVKLNVNPRGPHLYRRRPGTAAPGRPLVIVNDVAQAYFGISRKRMLGTPGISTR